LILISSWVYIPLFWYFLNGIWLFQFLTRWWVSQNKVLVLNKIATLKRTKLQTWYKETQAMWHVTHLVAAMLRTCRTVSCEECYKIAPISFISFRICGQVHFRVTISEPKPNFDRPTFITAVIISCSDQSFKLFVLVT
jgi:hypothetical protein